jgi:transcription antitermination factor NusG
MLSLDIDCFYPWIRVKPVNPRSAKIRPYFPGYLFVHVDLSQSGISTFQWMPFSSGLLSFMDDPAIVPENLIHAIQKRLEQINATSPQETPIAHGESVQIIEGPFAGYPAIFDIYVSGQERVRVLLKLLNDYQVSVVLPKRQIVPNKPHDPHQHS